MSLKHLTLQLEIRAVDASERIIEGYASTFGNIDSYGTKFASAAFDRTLRERPNVAVLVGHDSSQLSIGSPVEMRIDKTGLFTRTAIVPSPAGDELLARAAWLQKQGQPVGMSIGFRTQKSSWDGDVQVLDDVDLFEYSYVTFPANDQAHVTAVRADGEPEGPAEKLTRAIDVLTQARDEIALRVDAAAVLDLAVREYALSEAHTHVLRTALHAIGEVLGEEPEPEPETPPAADPPVTSPEERRVLIDQMIAAHRPKEPVHA